MIVEIPTSVFSFYYYDTLNYNDYKSEKMFVIFPSFNSCDINAELNNLPK